MKPFSFTNRRMTIRIHIFYSFLIHAVTLIFLLSLPVFRGSIHLKSYGDYFVYLRNEEVENAGKPLLTQMTKRKAKDLNTLKAGEADPKESAKRLEPKKTVSESESVLKMKETLEEKVKEANIEKGTPSSVLPEADTGVFPEAVSDNKPALSAEGFKEKAVHIRDEGEPVAEILTFEKNRTPSQEDYFLKQDREKRQTMAEIKPEVKERTMVEEKMPPSGIPVSDVLLLRDITVEVFLKKHFFFYSGSHAKKVPAPDTTKLKPLPKATKITNISLEESAGIVKLRIKGNGSMTSNVFSLYNNRIVIDIPKVVMNAPLPSVMVSPLKGIRSGKHRDKIRLVLDLKEMMNFDVSSFGDSVVVALKRLEKEPPLLPDVQKPEAAERKAEMSSVLLQLFKKAHPMVNRKDDSGKEKKVDILEEEETHIAGTAGVKRLFVEKRDLYRFFLPPLLPLGVKRVSVEKAEKGIYSFIVRNKGEESYEFDVVFRLFEGKPGERIKVFKAIELFPNAIIKFKFILPEAIFWDDEHYFTGTIESSNTLTKFSEKTGLIWKEEKDY